MDLQIFLVNKFRSWRPAQPTMLNRSKYHVTLCWSQADEPFGFLAGQLLYRLEKKEKIPPWVVVYSGGKTTKTIDNLAPCQPHKFKLQIQLRSPAVTQLAEKALQHYGNEQAVYDRFTETDYQAIEGDQGDYKTIITKETEINQIGNHVFQTNSKIDESGYHDQLDNKSRNSYGFNELSLKPYKQAKPWLESQWSEEVWTATDTEGPSVICFCMAVRYGYLKQVQQMLEDRPQLIEIINSVNGLTPLITAIRKGELATVKYLIQVGADVNQQSAAGQTPLQLAVYSARLDMAELLIEKGADVQARDLNSLRVEHYSVDSGQLEAVRFICDRGGDLTVRDNNGWTPLFRAVIQGAPLELIEELIERGADTCVIDYAGLTLAGAARLLKNRSGYPHDVVIRLVDASYPHEQAITHFTRLTKKISSMQSVFK